VATFKLTYVAKQYYTKEIEADSIDQAKELFDNIICDDDLDWDNPDELDAETFVEAV